MRCAAARRVAFALPAVSLLAGCLHLATIPPGYGGVLVTSSGVSSVPLGEGSTVIGPLSHVDVYDLRDQEHSEDLVALSADGAPVEARASLVAFHLVPAELPALEREVGPDYYRVAVVPIVRSAVFRVLGRYRAYQLDTDTIRRAQDAITAEARARLRPFHIVVDSVDLRTLAVLFSPRSYGVVVDTAREEQVKLGMPQQLELARRAARASVADARGIASADDTIAPTLTPTVLAEDAVRAWAALLASPTARVVVEDAVHPALLEISP